MIIANEHQSGLGQVGCCRVRMAAVLLLCSAPSVPQSVFTITEKAPTRAFSRLKAPTSAFTFKTLLRHYAKTGVDPTVSRREIGLPTISVFKGP